MKPKIELTKREAEAIIKVLDDGMPSEQSKRDFIAKIWCKLSKFTGNVHK